MWAFFSRSSLCLTEQNTSTTIKMAGKPTKSGNAFRPMKAKKRVPKPKMSYNKRLLSKMRTRLKKPPQGM